MILGALLELFCFSAAVGHKTNFTESEKRQAQQQLAEAGRLKIQYLQGNMIQYLEYLIESFHSLAFSRKVNLSFYTPTPTLIMDYDPTRCQEVVGNLISNALKFTPEYGSIKVIAREVLDSDHQKWLEVEVRDNGRGMHKDQLPSIFGRFYQGEDSTVYQGEGTGLGLAVVWELLDLMEGNIRVESEAGRGTRFIFRLPVHHTAERLVGSNIAPVTSFPAAPAMRSDDTSIFTPVPDKEKPQILIVGDNRDVIYYVKECIQEHYRIKMANNGREGIEKAITHIPDLISSDIMMPEVDGFELCRTLKTDERTNHIPIILLTAKVEQEDKLEDLSLGADAYLDKPFHKAELLIRIAKLIELRTQLQAKFQQTDPDPESVEDPFLLKVKKAIEANLEDADFGVIPLSRTLGMSRVQVHRKLKALTGQSTSELIRNLRLQKARELLLHSDLNVSEIAYRVGFKDPAHFSHAFSRRY